MRTRTAVLGMACSLIHGLGWAADKQPAKTNAAPRSCEIRSHPKRIPARGGSFAFTAEAKDADGKPVSNVSFTWSGSNFQVALIDPKSGRITTATPGDLVVIAKGRAPDGSEVLCTAELTVENSYQDVTVSGQVVGVNGSAVAGATVRAAGGAGVKTDDQGHFTAVAGRGPHVEGETITVMAASGLGSGQAAGTVKRGAVEGLTITLEAGFAESASSR